MHLFSWINLTRFVLSSCLDCLTFYCKQLFKLIELYAGIDQTFIDICNVFLNYSYINEFGGELVCLRFYSNVRCKLVVGSIDNQNDIQVSSKCLNM